jgi:polyhydroxyalkanoic acid synthase PhaR subunit
MSKYIILSYVRIVKIQIGSTRSWEKLTQQTFLDPFAIWKSMYEKTESKLNEVLHETMQKEAFSEWMGQVQNSYLQYQKFVQTSADNYLKQVNLPTRSEVSNVASLIINLEEKVDGLDQKIEEELLVNSSSSEISKLKSSIAKLDKKIDSLLKVVQQPVESAPAAAPQVTVPASKAEENKKSPNANANA